MPDAVRAAHYIDIADRAVLQVADEATSEVEECPTRVKDITDAGIVVALPRNKSAALTLREGSAVWVSIWKGYADHFFKSQVLQKIEDPAPQVLLAKPTPEDVIRITRRRDFRVDTRILTILTKVGAEGAAPMQAVMLNLSARGCRLQSQRHLDVGISLRLDFDLPYPENQGVPDEDRHLRGIPGKVRNMCLVSSARKSVSYMAGIEFAKLSNATVNALLHYVAFQQRNLIRRGLLK